MGKPIGTPEKSFLFDQALKLLIYPRESLLAMFATAKPITTMMKVVEFETDSFPIKSVTIGNVAA